MENIYIYIYICLKLGFLKGKQQILGLKQGTPSIARWPRRVRRRELSEFGSYALIRHS